MIRSDGAASLSIRSASAFAFCTVRIASASPSASRIFCSLTASAFRMADSFKPSATRIWLRFSPSASKIRARRSRSAFICFSMASWISRGGRIFFSSTRMTRMPHASVASSRIMRILSLMVSRLVSVLSSSKSPMIFLSVVAVRFSIALSGRSTP